jgi:NUDIX domain
VTVGDVLRQQGNRVDKKWHVIGSQTLLRDRWIDVRADECITAAGVKISPYYVLTYPNWVHVVAITSAGSLVLVRQYRHAVSEFLLELPGGAVDAEDPSLEQAARRELQEETGFTAQRWELSPACIRIPRRTPIACISFWPTTVSARIHKN